MINVEIYIKVKSVHNVTARLVVFLICALPLHKFSLTIFVFSPGVLLAPCCDGV